MRTSVAGVSFATICFGCSSSVSAVADDEDRRLERSHVIVFMCYPITPFARRHPAGLPNSCLDALLVAPDLITIAQIFAVAAFGRPVAVSNRDYLVDQQISLRLPR